MKIQNYEYYDEAYQEDFDANQVYNDFFEGLNMQANRAYIWPFSLFMGPKYEEIYYDEEEEPPVEQQK